MFIELDTGRSHVQISSHIPVDIAIDSFGKESAPGGISRGYEWSRWTRTAS